MESCFKDFDHNMSSKDCFDTDVDSICKGNEDPVAFSGDGGLFASLSSVKVESGTDVKRHFGCLIENRLEEVSLNVAFDCDKDIRDINECQTSGIGGADNVNAVKFGEDRMRTSGMDSTKPEVFVEMLGDVAECDDANTENKAVMESTKPDVLVRILGDVVKCDDADTENKAREDSTKQEVLVGKMGDVVESDDADTENDDTMSSSSSSSSSSGSSDEEDDREIRKAKNAEGAVDEKTELEEGEITIIEADDMVAWGDDEDNEAREAGPIKSKNEFEHLTPVPAVTVTLESHHQTVPVGTILSIVGSKVIVEGIEKHNPLNEGSILWINETRLPLGIVDEIFGPVKSPYYVVRFNSDDEVPREIEHGKVISFVEEFGGHVLNDKNLYKKGYDASGDNDEEISDEAEFSDDGKEAEYRKMQKTKKRCSNENIRKERNQLMNRNKKSVVPTCLGGLKAPDDHNPRASSSVSASTCSMDTQGPGLFMPNGMWNNGISTQQVDTRQIGRMLGNNTMWVQQNQASQPNPQQIGIMPTMNLNLNLNLNIMSLQPNVGMNQASVPPWPAGVDHNILNMLQFAVGLQSLQNPSPLQNVPNLQPSGSDVHAQHNGGRRGQTRGGRGNLRRGGGRH